MEFQTHPIQTFQEWGQHTCVHSKKGSGMGRGVGLECAMNKQSGAQCLDGNCGIDYCPRAQSQARNCAR